MGWGHKAIEIRSAETGHLDGVFMHKKAQKLKFLCERNDKVRTIYALNRCQLRKRFTVLVSNVDVESFYLLGVLLISSVRILVPDLLYDSK